jgi:hypothetical protein
MFVGTKAMSTAQKNLPLVQIPFLLRLALSPRLSERSEESF